jgi:hypothetical protein
LRGDFGEAAIEQLDTGGDGNDCAGGQRQGYEDTAHTTG